MLKSQIKTQHAKELARNYLAASGIKCTPEEYLIILKDMEKKFLILLNGMGD